MDLHIGAARITNIIEQDLTGIYQLLPDANRDAVQEIAWLTPHFADADGNLSGLIQAFVIEIADKTLVIDPCVGNGKTVPISEQWTNMSSGFMDRFRTAGFDPETVDFVLCTHMHMDHVGWNTYYDGTAWRPTFPNARYLFAETEMAAFESEIATEPQALPDKTPLKEAIPVLMHMTHHAVARQSIRPIIDAGLADLVAVPHVPVNGVTLVPTPGHTPGHVSVEIVSEGEKALITGDSFHHPCQIARPHWASVADDDQAASTATRQRLLAETAGTQTLVIGTHFNEPVCGHITDVNGRHRLIPHDG